jgi:hypothetical protein
VLNRRIGLVDIGLDVAFDASMTFVQSTLQNINAGHQDPVADIDFVRSRDLETVFAALAAEYHVLHVMAHGGHDGVPTFSSSDGRISVAMDELGRLAVERGRGLACGAVLADGCKTAVGVWRSVTASRATSPTSARAPTSAGTRARSSALRSTARCSATGARASRPPSRRSRPRSAP